MDQLLFLVIGKELETVLKKMNFLREEDMKI